MRRNGEKGSDEKHLFLWETQKLYLFACSTLTLITKKKHRLILSCEFKTNVHSMPFSLTSNIILKQMNSCLLFFPTLCKNRFECTCKYLKQWGSHWSILSATKVKAKLKRDLNVALSFWSLIKIIQCSLTFFFVVCLCRLLNCVERLDFSNYLDQSILQTSLSIGVSSSDYIILTYSGK